MSGPLDSAKPRTNSLGITNPVYKELSLLQIELYVIFFDMTIFSKNFHRYFGLSPFLGGIIIFIGKTDIGKHALFMMQKMEKRFVQKFIPFQGFMAFQ